MKRDDGFTLIELLVATALMVIVVGAVGTAFITAVRTTSGLTARYDRTFDAQALARYWARDVQTSDDVTRPAVGAAACDGTTAATVAVRFTNTDTSGANDLDTTVDYLWSAADVKLTRTSCRTTTGTTVVDITTISAFTPAAPSVTCAPAACPVGSSLRPSTVELTVGYSTSASDPEAYTYSTTAARRQYP